MPWTPEDEAELQRLKSRVAQTPATPSWTPEDEAELQRLKAQTPTWTPEDEAELQRLKSQSDPVAASMRARELGAPVAVSTPSGDISRAIQSNQEAVRAKHNAVDPTQQRQVEQLAAIAPPEPVGATNPASFRQNLSEAWQREIAEASEKLNFQSGDSSALRGLASVFGAPIPTKGNDVADAASTTGGAMQGIFSLGTAIGKATGREFGNVSRALKLQSDPANESAIDAKVPNFTGGREVLARVPLNSVEQTATSLEGPMALATEFLAPAGVLKAADKVASTVRTINQERAAEEAALAALEKANRAAAKADATDAAVDTGEGVAKARQDWETLLSDDVLKDLTDDAAVTMRAVPDSDKRVYLDLADQISEGRVGVDTVKDFIERNDMSPEVFVQVFKRTVSAHGRGLGRMSHLSKELAKNLRATNPELADELMAHRAGATSVFDKFMGAVQEVDQFRRIAGTSQFLTAVRNATVSVPLSAVGAVDKYFETVFLGGGKAASFDEAWKGLTSAGGLGQLTSRANSARAKQVTNIFDNAPRSATNFNRERFYGNLGITDASLMPTKGILGNIRDAATKVRNEKSLKASGELLSSGYEGTKAALTYFNRFQEGRIRRMAFESRLLQIRKVDSLADIDPTTITKAELDEVVDFALEITFANRPKSAAGNAALNAFTSLAPVTTSVAPFPRFMFYSLPRWTLNHSPLGLVKLGGGENLRKVLKEGDMSRTAKIFAEATTGTMMLSAGGMAYYGRDPSSKTTELVVNKEGGTVDGRSFSPLTSFPTILAKMIMDYDSVTPAEMTEAIIGIRETQNTPVGILADLARKDKEQISEGLTRMAGNYIGMMVVPFRMAKDAVSVFDPDEAVKRDRFSEPFLGPVKDNIPFLSQTLPPAQTITRSGAQVQDSGPVVRALTGITIKYRTEIEKALIEAGLPETRLYPRLGIDEADNFVVQKMGELAEKQGRQFLASDAYRQAPTKLKRAEELSAMFSAWRGVAVAQMAEERPDLFLRREIHNKLSTADVDMLDKFGVFENSTFKSLQGYEDWLNTGQMPVDTTPPESLRLPGAQF